MRKWNSIIIPDFAKHIIPSLGSRYEALGITIRVGGPGTEGLSISFALAALNTISVLGY
jgi:hypothetical protein